MARGRRSARRAATPPVAAAVPPVARSVSAVAAVAEDSDVSMESGDYDDYYWSGDERTGGYTGWQPDGSSDEYYGEGDDYEDFYDEDEDEEDASEFGDEEDDGSSADYASSPPPRVAAALAPPPPTLCRFFVLGKCRFGSRCTYSHALPGAVSSGEDNQPDEEMMATVAATMVDCPFFQRGNCKYGDYCRLRHATAATTAAAAASSSATYADFQISQVRGSRSSQTASVSGGRHTAASAASASNQDQDVTCGICFEDIVEAGKHFGLLSCDHCFCLDCLRSWRQAKDMEVEVTRACPACRLPSNYIVPSLKFCTGDEKMEVVDAYKRHLAIRECKYFDGTFGSCPFGSNCFYAHRNASGVDIKHLDRPRRSRRRSDSDESFVSSLGGSSRGGTSRRGGGRRPYPDALASLLDRYNEFFRFLESFDWEERDARQSAH